MLNKILYIYQHSFELHCYVTYHFDQFSFFSHEGWVKPCQVYYIQGAISQMKIVTQRQRELFFKRVSHLQNPLSFLLLLLISFDFLAWFKIPCMIYVSLIQWTIHLCFLLSYMTGVHIIYADAGIFLTLKWFIVVFWEELTS